MRSVLTLIADPAKPQITPARLSQATDVLSDVTGSAIETDILAEGIAADLHFTGEVPETLSAELVTALNAPVDVAIQPAVNRRRKLLIADMDSTIIRQECLDELADFAGVKDKVSAITERAMAGELNFEEALRERVAMLEGLPVKTLAETLTTRINLMPGAVTLVRTMNSLGAMTALVSGGFTFFTHRIAQAVGFQDNQGNILGERDGHLTGRVEEPILGREAKLEALLYHCDLEGIDPAEALAVGDGANDLAMITKAGMGVAYHAKPAVAAAARFAINHGDLTALLYLQGIRQSEFADS